MYHYQYKVCHYWENRSSTHQITFLKPGCHANSRAEIDFARIDKYLITFF